MVTAGGGAVESSASALLSILCACTAFAECGGRDWDLSGGGGGGKIGGEVLVRCGCNAGISIRCDFTLGCCEIDGRLSTGARRGDRPLSADVDLACGGVEPDVRLDVEGDRRDCGNRGAGRLFVLDDTIDDDALACCGTL